jgi:hypothetical protein
MTLKELNRHLGPSNAELQSDEAITLFVIIGS